MSGKIEAVFWAQVEPRWHSWYPHTLRGVKITKITQRKPREPVPGAVLVKLRLTLPVDAFVWPEFAASADVGLGELEVTPAQVEALPREDQ